MSDKVEVAEVAPLPDASYKYPNPLANFTKGLGYPEWQPIDTKKEVGQIFRFGFYSTVGAYAWLYFWKRTTFKLELPLSVIGFFSIAKGVQDSIANIREINDCWNTFWVDRCQHRCFECRFQKYATQAQDYNWCLGYFYCHNS